MAINKQKKNDYDVLIVGADPSSLVLALQLAQYGIHFQIVDSKSAFDDKSSAFTLQSSTLEVLTSLGVSENLIATGVQVRKVNAYINGSPSFEMDYRQEKASPFPFMLTMPQSHLQNVLADTLQKMNQHILWNVEIVKIKQSSAGVIAEVLQNGKKITTSASWIVANEGYDSPLRENLGIPFQGNIYTENFISADLEIQWALQKTEGYVFMHPSDIFAVFPIPGDKYRIITTQEGVAQPGKVTVEDLVTKFQKLVSVKGVLTAPTRLQAVETKRRVATRMKSGRVFLMGNAAHQLSPLGDHDLNLGIQDAFNLGWKLGYQLLGWVDEAYLDSYENERLKVAQSIHQDANTAMKILTTRSKIGQAIRDFIAPLILSYPAAQKQLSRILGDKKTFYGGSPITYSGGDSSTGVTGKIKESVLSGVFAGETAPSFDLLIPNNFKRIQLAKLRKSEKHVVLFFQGEQSKEYKSLYENFTKIKERLAGFANAYYIVGEHAVDYTSLDKEKEDIFIDPDGRGHQIYRCFEPTLFIIRPDGYISYRGSANLSWIERFMKQYFNSEAIVQGNDGKKVNVAV